MAVVSRQAPWWRTMLARWWAIESVCCFFAQRMITRYALQCPWCGRVLEMREWER